MLFLWLMAVWMWLFSSLILALLLLAAVYRLARAEMGLHFWTEEVAVAMAASLIQTGVFTVLWFWSALSVNPMIVIHLAVAFLAAVICYKAAHRTTMKFRAQLAIAAAQQAISLPLGMLLAGCLRAL